MDINRSLGDHVTNWDHSLLIAEFAYNSFVNQTIGHRSLEIVTGLQPRKPINWITLPPSARSSAKFETFASHTVMVCIQPKKFPMKITRNNIPRILIPTRL